MVFSDFRLNPLNVFFQMKGDVARPTTVDRLCTQCVYCEPRAVDYCGRLYDRFHLTAHDGDEYHFLHAQYHYNKWHILYVQRAVPQTPLAPARKKRSVSKASGVIAGCDMGAGPCHGKT